MPLALSSPARSLPQFPTRALTTQREPQGASREGPALPRGHANLGGVPFPGRCVSRLPAQLHVWLPGTACALGAVPAGPETPAGSTEPGGCGGCKGLGLVGPQALCSLILQPLASGGWTRATERQSWRLQPQMTPPPSLPSGSDLRGLHPSIISRGTRVPGLGSRAHPLLANDQSLHSHPTSACCHQDNGTKQPVTSLPPKAFDKSHPGFPATIRSPSALAL